MHKNITSLFAVSLTMIVVAFVWNSAFNLQQDTPEECTSYMDKGDCAVWENDKCVLGNCVHVEGVCVGCTKKSRSGPMVLGFLGLLLGVFALVSWMMCKKEHPKHNFGFRFY